MNPTSMLVNASALALLFFQLWALGTKPLRDLPGYLAFGAVVGAALTFIS